MALTGGAEGRAASEWGKSMGLQQRRDEKINYSPRVPNFVSHHIFSSTPRSSSTR
jgi:hypothetical protein